VPNIVFMKKGASGFCGRLSIGVSNAQAHSLPDPPSHYGPGIAIAWIDVLVDGLPTQAGMGSQRAYIAQAHFRDHQVVAALQLQVSPKLVKARLFHPACLTVIIFPFFQPYHGQESANLT
jgi:hypothetical protein